MLAFMKSESNFINEYMEDHFEMDGEEFKEDGVEFMGCFLYKLGEGKFGLMEWDHDSHAYSETEAWFTGTLKECCDKIIEVEA